MPVPLTRDPQALQTGTFDLLVVGGGIYGLTVACDAAQRGLRVALVERHDFGSGTSFNHLRTIHGGLRYLQTLDLPRARESVRERRTLARIAPWAVAPLPFVLPLYRSLMKGTTAMRAGFLLDALVAWDKNAGVPPAHQLPLGQVLSRAEAQARYPPLRPLPIQPDFNQRRQAVTQRRRQPVGLQYGNFTLDQPRIAQPLDAAQTGRRRHMHPLGQGLIAQAGIGLQQVKQMNIDGINADLFHKIIFFEIKFNKS